MTPSARLSASIKLLDKILAGEPAERSLTRWARASRYAGSKDRAAIRDIVFDCLRNKRSFSHLGGGMNGRAIVVAHQFQAKSNLNAIFTGEGFAPAVLTHAELEALENPPPAPDPVRLDFPDFLETELNASLGEEFDNILSAMQARAPVDLRVNTLKTTLAEAQNLLARDLIFTDILPELSNALRITQNPRKLNGSLAYRYGFVELQDLSSQTIASFTGVKPGMRVLDYCAGGGGKTLALAALMEQKGTLLAHDVNPARMKDLPERARRAGATIQVLPPNQVALTQKCDLVLVDAPCSGSGAWRRNPDSKWRLSGQALEKLTLLQDEILGLAKNFVKPGGKLAYATCSLFELENDQRVEHFLQENADWTQEKQIHLTPSTGGDGFFGSILIKLP